MRGLECDLCDTAAERESLKISRRGPVAVRHSPTSKYFYYSKAIILMRISWLNDSENERTNIASRDETPMVRRGS
jgi:hypothetical protein